MLFYTLNIMFCMQHNILKRKPCHVFNNNFGPKFLAIVPINLFFFDGCFSFLSSLFRYAAVTRLSFYYWINARWSIYFIYGLIYPPPKISKYISFIILVCWCRFWVKTITVVENFQGIISIRDCAVARYYKTIFI